MSVLRNVLLGAATSGPISGLWGLLGGGRARIPVFMLHRFADPRVGNPGFDPRTLRTALAMLQRRRIRVLGLGEAMDRLRSSAPVSKAVVLTVDDGYADFLTTGLPVLQEFGCPVTVFLTTGFLDGRHWMWWDRVHELWSRSSAASVEIRIGGEVIAAHRGSPEWPAASTRTVAACKRLPDPERRRILDVLTRELAVDLPDVPPPAYAPMSWAGARAAAEAGVTFGPHTITHPILSRVDAEAVRREIAGSWDRVRDELPAQACLPCFCYPNGEPGDQGPREADVLAGLRFSGAFTTTPGYVGDEALKHPTSRYELPRFPFPHRVRDLLQVVTGLEAVKMAARDRMPLR